jgi:TetR/AcrR family transcriptional regulator, ethionamide resistance regulator
LGAVGEVAQQPRRRRRRPPEEAEREILRAAETFLAEHPFRELTVDLVMQRTGLSRPSFYVYFRDRHHLLARLVEDSGTDLFAAGIAWEESRATGPEAVRSALEGFVHAFAGKGRLMRALADAAACDPGAEHLHAQLVGRAVDFTADLIDRDQRTGTALPCDPRATAEALVLMSERYLLARYGATSTPDPAPAVDTLATIWLRTLYPA